MQRELQIAVLFVMVPLLVGCVGKPSGYHTEPTDAHFDEKIILERKNIIRGSHGLGASVRYSDEQEFYRIRGQKEYKQAEVERTHSGYEEMIYQATIPPISASEGEVLEYYMIGKFDDRPFQSGTFDEKQQYAEINAENPYAITLKKRVPFVNKVHK
jgi:hypothetical protein